MTSYFVTCFALFKMMDYSSNKENSNKNDNNKEILPEDDWRKKLRIIIFGTHTPGGKRFDVILLWAIILSILTVMLESVPAIQQEYGDILRIVEWCFTILFTIEYGARIISTSNPLRYIFSFYGIVDLLSILPTYISLFVASSSHYLIVIRTLRLLRIFRIFKLTRFVGEAQMLKSALIASVHKISVFFIMVLTIVIITGTLMYLIEGPKHGFDSIPRSIYWAVVTLTTVGYGDIAPETIAGQFFASFIMILGYTIIAVPTGIVTAEMTKATRKKLPLKACPSCHHIEHDLQANFCKQCGQKFNL